MTFKHLTSRERRPGLVGVGNVIGLVVVAAAVCHCQQQPAGTEDNTSQTESYDRSLNQYYDAGFYIDSRPTTGLGELANSESNLAQGTGAYTWSGDLAIGRVRNVGVELRNPDVSVKYKVLVNRRVVVQSRTLQSVLSAPTTGLTFKFRAANATVRPEDLTLAITGGQFVSIASDANCYSKIPAKGQTDLQLCLARDVINTASGKDVIVMVGVKPTPTGSATRPFTSATDSVSVTVTGGGIPSNATNSRTLKDMLFAPPESTLADGLLRISQTGTALPPGTDVLADAELVRRCESLRDADPAGCTASMETFAAALFAKAASEKNNSQDNTAECARVVAIRGTYIEKLTSVCTRTCIAANRELSLAAFDRAKTLYCAS